MSRRARSLAWLLGALALWETPAWAAPPCVAQVELEPERAVVDQQVLYRLRIFTREDVHDVGWVAAPDFPGFRAERLSPAPTSAPILRDGARYRVREETRALFPERSGELTLHSEGLVCTFGDAAEARSVIAPVADARLAVEPLPEADRPLDFAGLVGRLVVRSRAEPREIRVGESTRIEVSLRGGGNLWDARDPLSDKDFADDVELIRGGPELELTPGVQLNVERRFHYDLVPHRAGTVVVPALEIAYFDPRTRRYRRASAPALAVSVAPREAVAPPPSGASSDPSPPTPPSESAARRWWWAAGAGLSAVGCGLAWLWRRRRPTPGEEALRAAAACRSAGDTDGEAAALTRALREALAVRDAEAAALEPDRLLDRAPLPPEVATAARLLRQLDRSRFAREGAAPDPADVARAIAAL